MKYALYIQEAKMCLTTDKTFDEIAKEFGCSSVTLANRFYKTIGRIVEYYDFDALKIEYPKSCERGWYNDKYKNARKHRDYWIKIISDYEKGIKSYKHNLPVEISDSRRIGDLTVSEFRELINSLLSAANSEK